MDNLRPSEVCSIDMYIFPENGALGLCAFYMCVSVCIHIVCGGVHWMLTSPQGQGASGDTGSGDPGQEVHWVGGYGSRTGPPGLPHSQSPDGHCSLCCCHTDWGQATPAATQTHSLNHQTPSLQWHLHCTL